MPKCTYCGGTKWFGGPSGGMSQNILCANPSCRHWFNYAEGFMFDDLEKVEPTADEAAEAEAKKKAKKDAEMQAFMQEGKALFAEGKSSWDCLTNPERFTSVPWSMLYKMLGYMDALAEEVRKK